MKLLLQMNGIYEEVTRKSEIAYLRRVRQVIKGNWMEEPGPSHQNKGPSSQKIPHWFTKEEIEASTQGSSS